MGTITAPAGCTLVGAGYHCTGLALNTGATRTFAFIGTIAVGSASTVTLSTSLLDGVPPDPNPANNSQEKNIDVPAGSDVRVSKSRSPAGELIVGQTVTFTLTPSYSGEVPNGLTLEDTLPANYSLVSVTPATGSGWTCTTVGQKVSCTKPSSLPVQMTPFSAGDSNT
jgi:uncharacterized repeat protein (TIGR01451 family)